MVTRLKVLRWPSAVLLALVTGMWGLIILFSDYRGTTSMWLLYVIASHVVPGFVIGMLVPSRWYFSVLATWGAMIIGLLFSAALIFNPPPTITPANLALPGLGLLVIPALTAFAGYTGSKALEAFKSRLGSR